METLEIKSQEDMHITYAYLPDFLCYIITNSKFGGIKN